MRLAGAIILWAVTAHAETLRFEIRAVQADGKWKSIHKGERTYSLKDVIVDQLPDAGEPQHWSKALSLSGPFSVDVDVYSRKAVDGFGLTIDESGNGRGFSWNWFDRTKGDIFTQLRGGARIKVRMTGLGVSQEVASIEFLDDCVLAYSDRRTSQEPGEYSHVVVIFKGSVLRVAP